MPVSTLIASVLAVLMVVVAGILGGFLWSARGDLAQRDARSADGDRAEQLATKYAVGAATIKFDDINSWIGQLKAGTSPQLADKFDATAPKLEEILTPLKWTSTASPIAATVASVNGGIYKVDVFVNVSSTNAQNPQGAQTTVTYDITLDKNSDWQITDVGGVNAALPVK
jgi:Mce-associated membrane protein